MEAKKTAKAKKPKEVSKPARKAPQKQNLKRIQFRYHAP